MNEPFPQSMTESEATEITPHIGLVGRNGCAAEALRVTSSAYPLDAHLSSDDDRDTGKTTHTC